MSALAPFEPLALALGDRLRSRGWRLATAESCTGGLLAAACTAVAGSSDWFERGFVTYSNEAKSSLLGVEPQAIAQHGAVSEAVARQMARGALRAAPVQLAVSVTGIAGPGGAVPGKPVGTVWLAWAADAATGLGPPGVDGPGVVGGARCLQLSGDRAAVREQTVEHALNQLLAWLAAAPGAGARLP